MPGQPLHPRHGAMVAAGILPPRHVDPGLTKRRIRRVIAAIVCAVAVVVAWWLLVNTPVGQGVDTLAMLRARNLANHTFGADRLVLSAVSVPTIIAAMVLAGVIAICRRRWLLGVRAAGLIAAATITTQVLKQYVFTRPELIASYKLANSLPSGHTTVAAAALGALIIVVPVRWRSLLAIIATGVTIMMGMATLINGWHRPSDVITAVLVTLFWALVLAPLEVTRARPTPVPVILTTIGLIAALVGAVATAMAVWMFTDTDALTDITDSVFLLQNSADSGGLLAQTCLIAGLAVMVAVTCLGFAEVDRANQPPSTIRTRLSAAVNGPNSSQF